MTMGNIKRLPLKGNSQRLVGKPISHTPTYKFCIKEKIKDLEEYMKVVESRRSEHRKVRAYLTNEAMHYSDPVVVARAKVDHERWTAWGEMWDEGFSRHLASLEAEFDQYLAERKKRMDKVTI